MMLCVMNMCCVYMTCWCVVHSVVRVVVVVVVVVV